MEIHQNVPLAPYTTMGLGGKARFFARGTDIDSLCQYLEWATAQKIEVLVLGGGSNLLLPDEGFDGLALQIGLKGIHFVPRQGSMEVHAAAGEEWDDLVSRCINAGLAGIECLSGIPGYVGATPVQNVGAYGQELAQTLVEVEALDRRDLSIVTFKADQCDFAYRYSRFKGPDRDRYLITAVRLALAPDVPPRIRYPELLSQLGAPPTVGGPDTLRQVRQAVLGLRRTKSMLIDPQDPNTRSAGSFFVNPILAPPAFAALEQNWRDSGDSSPVPSFAAPEGIKVPAAWLIERAGFLRGYQRDGAAISENHALALVNRGTTAAAVRRLARDIAAAVEARFGVALQPEPVIIEPPAQ
jgi:UDP-N-acetylmuramate dehydrogenase